jgi:predicted Zn-dependent protease
MIKSPNHFDSLLEQGVHAVEQGQLADAMGLLKRAAVEDFRKPEPWYWIGRIYRTQGKMEAAGYAFFMALDLDGTCRGAREALQGLGYLGRE